MKRYTETHEWVEIHGEIATVGISNFAQKELGDIVSVELPRVGSRVKAQQEAVVLESTKAAADVYSPVTGLIIATNAALIDHPDIINKSAEIDGWLFKINVSDPSELDSLMETDRYLEFIKE